MPALVTRGAIHTAEAFYTDADGNPADPVDPQLSVIDATGATFLLLVTPSAHPGVGHYQHPYLIPEDAPLGAWEDVFYGLVDGFQTGPVDDGFTVVPESALVPPSPDALTCAPWASEADLCEPCVDYDSELTLAAADFIQTASDLLYEWSGSKYPGECTTTVRPCAMRLGGGRDRRALPAGYTSGWGSCGCADACGCGSSSRIELGAAPIVDVLEVKVDGVVLDSSRYRVDDKRTLVRLRDPDGSQPGWPRTQRLDLPDTEEGTWSVTYVWGRNPTPAGVHAAAVLACELAMACDPENAPNCRLSARNVSQVSREGVTVVLNASSFLDSTGKTGLWEVDVFLSASNPDGRRRQSSVWWPGAPRVVRPG